MERFGTPARAKRAMGAMVEQTLLLRLLLRGR